MKNISILFFILIFTCNLAYSQSWQRINSPTGGTVTAVASDNTNGILYAGTLLDGVYKSTNQGANWTHLSIAGIRPVTCIAVKSDGTIFLATGNNAISLPFGNVGGMTDTNAVYKSTDQGNSFTPLNLSVGRTNYSNASYVISTIGIDSNGTIYLGYGTGILSSTDNGSTWAFNNPGQGAIVNFLLAYNGDFYAATTTNKILTTNDNGTIWKVVSTVGVSGSLIGFTVNNMGTFFAAIGGGVYRSTDNGGTWKTVYNTYNAQSIFSDFKGNIYVEANNEHYNINLFVKSSDDGTTWKATSTTSISENPAFPSPINQPNNCAVDASGNLFVGDGYMGVLKSANLDSTWTQSSNGINCTWGSQLVITPKGTIFFDDGYGTDQRQGVFRSTDGGTTWGPWYGSSTTITINISKTLISNLLLMQNGYNSNLELLCTIGDTLISQGGTNGLNYVLISSDEGNTWLGYGVGGTGGPTDFAFSANGNIYMSTFANGIYGSTTGGTSWSLKADGKKNFIGSSIIVNPITGRILTSGAFTNGGTGTYYSDDNGSTWDTCYNIGSGFLKVNSAGTILLLGSGNVHSGLNISTDNGVTFTNISGQKPAINDFFIDDSGKIVVATSNGVYYSIDNGVTWQSNNSGLPPWQNVLALAHENSGNVYATVQGLGLYKTSNLVVTAVTNKNKLPSQFVLNQNYPNPFNPSTNINYSLPTSGLVLIKVYDILGREIKTLVNGYKSAGNYSVSFEASRLASGVYFYRMQAGNFVQTKKLLLLK
jgi:photosystem II stability/assembly factor-like uncharacterized protein